MARRPQREAATVYFVVDDLDGIVERLARNGFTAELINDETYGRFSWAADLEGNRSEFW